MFFLIRSCRRWCCCPERPISRRARPVCSHVENTGKFPFYQLICGRAASRWLICNPCTSTVCFQELSGQQQSTSESEFDFPQEETPFTSSEFREEHADFTADHTETGTDGTAGTSNTSGKKSMFEGYKDPSNQFSGHTRSYHQDARSVSVNSLYF